MDGLKRLTNKNPWGIGQIRERLARRGGNWTNTSNAGVFSLNLNNTRSNLDSNIGFRSSWFSLSEVISVLRLYPVLKKTD